MKKSLYIAGKMRGIPYYNFPAFDAARDRLVGLGFEVLSPADMDRESGFDPLGFDEHLVALANDGGPSCWDVLPGNFDLSAAIRRDNEAIAKADGVFVLHEGFSDSAGAIAEVGLAMKLGKTLVYDTMTDAQILKAMGVEKESGGDFSLTGYLEKHPIPSHLRHLFPDTPNVVRAQSLNARGLAMWQETHAGEQTVTVDPVPLSNVHYTEREAVLEDAKKLITGDRNISYGPPTRDFQRSADMMTALFSDKLKDGERFKASDVSWIITLVKASRAQHSPKRDNYVDGAGYMGCGWECEVEEQKKAEMRNSCVNTKGECK